jgi:outer membrane protein TolC
MKKNRTVCKLIFLSATASLMSLASAFAAPGDLNLASYLGQVEEKDTALKAADAGIEGYFLLRDSDDILVTPTLFGNFTKSKNQEEQASPVFMGNRTDATAYSVGLAMNTDFGLTGKYTFNVNNTEIFGVDRTLFPLPKFSTAYNKLELTQSLIQNGFGSRIRAQREQIRAGVLAGEYSARFQAQSRLVQAENAFWRLAFARRSVEIQTEIIGRSNKALEWARRRTNLQLGDRSDLLQAQASSDLNQLQMQSFEEEVRNASRAFNLYRNQEGDVVAERLVLPTIAETIEAPAPERGKRLDIMAAEQQQKVAEADAQVRAENYKPQVDVFANLAWMGRDGASTPAIKEGFSSKNPNTSFGVNISVPLAPGKLTDSIRGALMAKEASRLTYEQQLLDDKLGWDEISSKLKDAKTRLKLLRTIEIVQKDKYENERQRLLRGRTTTFQSLQFEQEYAATQLRSLSNQAEVLGLLAQMKLYRSEQ